MFRSCHILKQEPTLLFRQFLEGFWQACGIQFPKHGVLCPWSVWLGFWLLRCSCSQCRSCDTLWCPKCFWYL